MPAPVDFVAVVFSDLSHYFSGHAHSKTVRWNLRTGCDDGSCGDYRTRSDNRPVQNDRTHRDEAIGFHPAPMKNGSVTDCHPLANVNRVLIGDMNQAPVLDIRITADVDTIDVTTQNAVKPDARAFGNVRATDDNSGRCHENTLVDFRLVIFKWIKHA